MHLNQVKSSSAQRNPVAGRNAFTILELLVVVAIIGILAALVIASFPRFIQRGQMAQSLSNLRQIGVAFQLYANDNDFSLPGRIDEGNKWPALLVNYLGDDPKVYADPADDRNYLAEKNDPIANNRNNTSYIMNGYNDLGAYDDPSVTIKANVVEQPSKTILAAAQKHSGNFYMDFVEKNEEKVLNKRLYGDGSTYLFVDGSSRFIKEADYENDLWLVFKDGDPMGEN